MELEHSPLDANHRALGAKMVEFGGWDMPLSYPDGTIAEHLACRNGAVVFDVSHLGTVRVEGGDALDRLQWALTNDLTKVAPGRAQYTHLLDETDGSVLDDIIVWWIDDDVFDVMPNASNTDRVRNAIGGTETTHARAVLAVQGPQAREAVSTFWPAAAGVGRFRVQRLQWQGVPVTVAGTGYTGEDGIEIAVPIQAAAADLGCDRRRRGRARWPRCPRHAAPRGSAPAPRPRARSRHHAAAGRARLGRGLAQGRVPRARARWRWRRPRA